MAKLPRKKALRFIVQHLRRKGLSVRSTKNYRDGSPSSYYARKRDTEVRLSDHPIPFNEEREQVARQHGHHFHGYHSGPEIIVRVPLYASQARRVAEMIRKGYYASANQFLAHVQDSREGNDHATKE